MVASARPRSAAAGRSCRTGSRRAPRRRATRAAPARRRAGAAARRSRRRRAAAGRARRPAWSAAAAPRVGRSPQDQLRAAKQRHATFAGTEHRHRPDVGGPPEMVGAALAADRAVARGRQEVALQLDGGEVLRPIGQVGDAGVAGSSCRQAGSRWPRADSRSARASTAGSPARRRARPSSILVTTRPKRPGRQSAWRWCSVSAVTSALGIAALRSTWRTVQHSQRERPAAASRVSLLDGYLSA